MQRKNPRLPWRVAAVAILTVLRPALAEGQRLIRFENIFPEGPGLSASVPTSISSGVRLHHATVDLALIRGGPDVLELHTPDGRRLRAQRTAFEDRGNGNAYWAGRIAGASYDTVVLTLQDGHLVGTYGEPGRHKFELIARREAGIVREPIAGAVGTAGALDTRKECEARSPPLPVGAREAASTSGGDPADPPPKGIAGFQTIGTSTHRLDVLVLYTQAASNYWTTSDAAAVQAAVDYVNTV